jgi:hypothetical protein
MESKRTMRKEVAKKPKARLTIFADTSCIVSRSVATTKKYKKLKNLHRNRRERE